MKKGLVLALAVVILISVSAVAMAVSVPNAKDTGLDALVPEVPTMTTKSDGKTTTATLSAPMSWMCAIFDWKWVPVEWADGTNTVAKVDLTQQKFNQGFSQWGEIPYAYDGDTADGVNVKYDNYGRIVFAAVKTTGTSVFDNGEAATTTVVFKFDKDSAGKAKTYIDEITEEYADGSKIHARFTMNGTPISADLTDADGKHTVLLKKAVAPIKSGSVLFEGSATGKWTSDWTGTWYSDNVALDLNNYMSPKDLQPGESIAVTYQSNWNPIMLVVNAGLADGTTNWFQSSFDTAVNKLEDGSKYSTISYETIASVTGELASIPNFWQFALYGYGEDATVTKVEILPAE